MTNVSDSLDTITNHGGTKARRQIITRLRVAGSPWLVAAFVLCTSSVHAQGVATGSIAGVVKDASGGVLPGVTVEASSPALIEKARTVVTDETGSYRLIDLRPGPYAVTFSLSGFTFATSSAGAYIGPGGRVLLQLANQSNNLTIFFGKPSLNL